MPVGIFKSGPLAQLAEQQTLNLRVLGSIPRRLTTYKSFIYNYLQTLDACGVEGVIWL